jgi:GNAT superfamily N-acetyltransferase
MNEAAESNAAFVDFWKTIYPKLPRGEYREMAGISAVWGDVTLPFCNAVLLSHPVKDRADLESRVETLQAFLAKKNQPPMFLVCQDWLPDTVRPLADAIIARARLRPEIPLRGMAAGHILAPVRSLPELEYRRVSDQETRNLISDINSVAYGFPVEHGREAFAAHQIWQPGNHAYIGYRAGQPVAVSATAVLDGYLYIGFVATRPELQRNGYAEAVMRHSLAEAARATGLQRSLLHATDAGRPVYLRMGYRDTARFIGYVSV